MKKGIDKRRIATYLVATLIFTGWVYFMTDTVVKQVDEESSVVLIHSKQLEGLLKN